MGMLSPSGQPPQLFPGAVAQEQNDPAMEFARRYRALLEQSGMLPQTQMPMPSQEDIAAANKQRMFTKYMRPVNAFAGLAPGNPEEEYQKALASRVAANPQALQYAQEVERAKAMRDLTSPDLITYMGHLASGGSMPLAEFMMSQRSSGAPNDFMIKLQTLQAIRQQQAQRTGQPAQPITEQDLYKLLRGDQTGMMGNVGYRLDPVTGQAVLLASPEEVGQMAETVQRGQASGQQVGTGEGKRLTEATNNIYSFADAYSGAQSIRDRSESFKQQIESGEIETGPINTFIYNMTGLNAGQVAGMKAAQIEQALADLGRTNLAPVSNVELALIMQMWANIASGKEANTQTLDQAINSTRKLQNKMVAQLKRNAYYLKKTSPEDYEAIVNSLDEGTLQFLNNNQQQTAEPPPPAG